MVRKEICRHPSTDARASSIPITISTGMIQPANRGIRSIDPSASLVEWGERTPSTKIVAIGSSKKTDHGLLTALFESCVAELEVAR